MQSEHEIRKKSESEKGSYALVYMYGPRPHLPIEIEENITSDIRKHCFAYDANGNKIAFASSDKIGGLFLNSTTTQSQQHWDDLCTLFLQGITNPSYALTSRKVVWDEDNQVRAISKNNQATVKFTRNYEHSRTVKDGDNGLSLYFNQYYSQDKSRRMKHIYAQGELVSMKYEDNSFRCGAPYAIDQQGCQYFFHTEDGSPNWITDERGYPIMHFEYIPDSGEKWVFEEVTEFSAPAFTHNYPVGHQFKEWDDETNLYHGHKHYFDPHLNIDL